MMTVTASLAESFKGTFSVTTANDVCISVVVSHPGFLFIVFVVGKSV